MKKFNLWKLLFTAFFAFAAAAFVGCVDDNEDDGMPYLEVTPTTLAFDLSGDPAAGSTGKFVVKTNRPWELVIPAQADWVRPSATKGTGSAEVSFNLPGSQIAREARLTFQVYNPYGPYLTQEVTVQQGEIVPPIYWETFGTEGGSASPYPFLDEYTGFVHTGEGAADVTYTGSGVSLRNTGSLSQGYPDASGHTKAFFGSGTPNMVVNNIKLGEDQTNLKLTFGGVFYEYATKDNVFKPEKFHVYLSADGTTWSDALEYTIVDAADNWVYATADFSLANAVSALYIKFVADIASCYAIDDPTLLTGPGGQSVDLGSGSGGGVVVTTKPATDVTETGATLAGAVSTTEGVTAVGFQYTENASSIDWSSVAKVAVEPVAATFTKAVTGLTAGTTYAVRAYATTADGDKNGAVLTFTPSSKPSGDKIVVDFSDLSNYPSGFPTKKGTVDLTTYNFGGYDFTFFGVLNTAGDKGGYYSSTYQSVTSLIWGQNGAYIGLPAMADKALTKVVCKVPDGASAAVQVGVFDASGQPVSGGEVITWTKPASGERIYTYTLSNTAANTSYRLQINSAHNSQLNQLELYYGDGGGTTDPSISVDPTSLSFTADADNTGKTITVSVDHQGAYNLYAKSSDNTQFPTTLSGSTVTVKAAANTTAQAKSATITIYLATAEGMTPVAQQTVSVTQAAAGGSSGDVYYHTNVGTKAVADKPFADSYDDWQATGSGAANVSYTSNNVSVRSTGKASSGAYEGASGSNVLFFGKTPAYISINNIVVPSSQKNMQLTFGASRSLQNGATFDNDFDASKFLVSLSSDGTNWKQITYNDNDGDTKEPYWVFATADFTLTQGVSAIYVKFEATEASVYRLDDITLQSGNGGQSVDLGGGSDTPTLEVSPLTVTLGKASGATKTFSITTTAAWTATASGSGFAIDKTNGTGNATVTVTTSAANTEASKKSLGSVVVALAGGASASQTVTVEQEAGGSTPLPNTIVADFNQGAGIATPAIPTSKVTGPVTATYTIAGYDFVVNAPAAYYFLDGSQYGTPEPNKGLYISKQGAYLAFPAIAGKSLQKVVVSTPNSSGSAIEIAINDANGVAAEGGTNQTIASNETVTFNLENTLENTSYRIEVMNAKNFQINKLELTYSAGGSTPTTPAITAVTPSSLTWEADDAAAQSVTATVSNQNGAALSVSDIAPFTAAINGNTITVTPPQAGNADLVKTMTVTVAGGNSMNVTLTKKAPQSVGGGLTLVTTVNGLSEGTYYMAGFAQNAYNIWNGTLMGGQCMTSPYSFADGKLTATTSFDDLTEVTLKKADGVADAYYIINKDGKYLTVSAAGKNKLSLADTAGDNYWTLSDYDENGVKASAKAFEANMFTSTGASSKFIRSYVITNNTGVGGISFFKKN